MARRRTDSDTSLDIAPPTQAELDFAEERKLLKDVREAQGGPAVSAAVDRFTERVGALPGDFEVLTKALGHERAGAVLEVLDQIADEVARQRPAKTQTLAAHLKLLEESHPDGQVRSRAAAVRAAL